MSYRRRNSGVMDFLGNAMTVGTGLICVASLFVLFMVCIYRPINKTKDMRDVTLTVTRVAVKNSGNNGKYLVFGDDQNGESQVLEVTDSWLKGRFDSSDMWGDIKEGKTYTFTVGGKRSEFWSWYPNIYEMVEIEEGDVATND